MVIHGGAWWKIMRQIRPWAARFIDIQNRIPHPSQRHFQGAARPYLFCSTKALFHHRPFFIRQITGVAFISHHFEFAPVLIKILFLQANHIIFV
jgi:hypothetical protein